MSKKKTSTQDFLNLLEDESPAAAPMAFNPAKKKAAAPKVAKTASKPLPRVEPRKLSTKEKILAELIDLAKKKSPRFVSDLITTWLPTDFGKTRKSTRR